MVANRFHLAFNGARKWTAKRTLKTRVFPFFFWGAIHVFDRFFLVDLKNAYFFDENANGDCSCETHFSPVTSYKRSLKIRK